MIDVFRLTEAMKDLWGASGTEIEMEKNSFKQKKNGQNVFQLIAVHEIIYCFQFCIFC